VDAAGWDKRYAEGRQWSREPNRFFEAVVSALGVRPGRAIDLACGEGRNALWLAAQGWDVTAVDFSRVAIERGQAMAAEEGIDTAGIDWIVADLRDHDLGEQRWDLVAHVYMHWPTVEREPFLRREAAAVAPGGHLVLVGHDRTNIEHGHGGPQDPDVLTTPDELAAAFTAAGLVVLDARVVTREIRVDDSLVHALDHVVVARRDA
jgi:2-polyprenyl-3-methyl-5-hydroxy-6-metoxy-1,4-benzoquinol methylase